MQVAWGTPMEKLDQLEKCLHNWLQTEENRWFQPSTSITLPYIDYQLHLELTIGIPYNSTWQDRGLHLVRKGPCHAAINYYCRQFGIVAYANPGTLDVNPAIVTPLEEYADAGEVPEADRRERGNWLGFQPPLEDGIPSRMCRPRRRARRRCSIRLAAQSASWPVRGQAEGLLAACLRRESLFGQGESEGAGQNV